ncbi:hypothetical protein DMN91_001267 [Ooceraea biroi]|uniref:Uncharacterized protein n=1 Tax=Ooceraea biroi TaxID=2015173 RepID=A0A3L8E4U0_OOCBI|nr:uncharacterized protein LOC105278510 [Ooceraea biroi]RLU27463.1 hypothetical protein DMN91_001267 [Ooceraea biroi]
MRVNEILDILSKDVDDGTKAIAQLCLLSYMIPPKGRIRTSKGHWKSSMSESEESLVAHVKVAAHVASVRESRVNVMNLQKLTVQPYIIVVGPTLDNIKAYFVSIDSILYSVPTAFEAIDVCFKSFHVFAATYPPASEHIWYLIQRELYNFSTKFDRPIGYIIEIMTALRAIGETEEI